MTVVIRCSATSVGLGVVEHDVLQANHECLLVIESLHELGNARVIVHERFEFAAGRDLFLHSLPHVQQPFLKLLLVTGDTQFL